MSAVSKVTSAFTVFETNHGQQRKDERNSSPIQLQRAAKHGVKTAQVGNKLMYDPNEIVYVTDAQSRTFITCWKEGG
jgi:hypothetical protein